MSTRLQGFRFGRDYSLPSLITILISEVLTYLIFSVGLCDLDIAGTRIIRLEFYCRKITSPPLKPVQYFGNGCFAIGM